jgi:hypothetical protein
LVDISVYNASYTEILQEENPKAFEKMGVLLKEGSGKQYIMELGKLATKGLAEALQQTEVPLVKMHRTGSSNKTKYHFTVDKAEIEADLA